MAMATRGASILAVGVPLLAAALGGGIGSLLTYWNTDRQIDVKMIEIAVGILAKEPESGLTPAREWAVELIAHYSEDAVKPSEAVKAALVNNKGFSFSYRFYPDQSYTFYPSEGERPPSPNVTNDN